MYMHVFHHIHTHKVKWLPVICQNFNFLYLWFFFVFLANMYYLDNLENTCFKFHSLKYPEVVSHGISFYALVEASFLLTNLRWEAPSSRAAGRHDAQSCRVPSTVPEHRGWGLLFFHSCLETLSKECFVIMFRNFPSCFKVDWLLRNKNQNTLRARAVDLGSAGGSAGKESTCQPRRHGLEPWVRKIPPEEEMATHSSVLAWKIPRTEEPGRLQSMRSQSQTWFSNWAHIHTHLTLYILTQ